MKMNLPIFHLLKKQLIIIRTLHFSSISNQKLLFRKVQIYIAIYFCITSYLRNYDPIKQNFCLLSYNDTSRPIIVPQEYLIHFDDFLLSCNVPTIIAKPLTAIKHLVSALLNDKEKSYFTALSKQVDSSNELLFISAKVITFMVKAEKAKSLKQYTTPEQ